MVDYFGKYRGEVINNIDPAKLGRIQVNVPSVLGQSPPVWAMPCTPLAGPGMGFWALPPVGASVWVEFEAGDANSPIWTGCFWQTADDLPAAAKTSEPETVVFQVPGLTLTIQVNGGLLLTVSPPIVNKTLHVNLSNERMLLSNHLQTKMKITPAKVSLRSKPRPDLSPDIPPNLVPIAPGVYVDITFNAYDPSTYVPPTLSLNLVPLSPGFYRDTNFNASDPSTYHPIFRR